MKFLGLVQVGFTVQPDVLDLLAAYISDAEVCVRLRLPTNFWKKGYDMWLKLASLGNVCSLFIWIQTNFVFCIDSAT